MGLRQTSGVNPQGDPKALAAFIDHTALKVDVDAAQVDRLCDEAIEHSFASVCVQPIWVERAARRLAGHGPKVCTVVGFPMGQNLSVTKAAEAARAVELGAEEIDMVVAWGALRRGERDAVQADIRAVVDAVPGVCVKVILESAGLEPEHIRIGCEAAVAAGAHFVKTSTGFGPGGATVADVRLMREVVGPDFGVKASGGIRDAATAQAMIDAGANRLGCSAGVAIVAGATSDAAY